MSHTRRHRRLVQIAALSAVTMPLVALSSGSAVAARTHVASHRAGRIGSPLVLDSHVDYSGYDEATDAAGDAYIGWIANTSTSNSATRAVFLCTLKPGASSCADGGPQHVSGIDGSSAAGLRIFSTASGHVTLVWFHDDTASENGSDGSSIAETTSDRGGPLTSPTDVVTNAPSFGSMLTAAHGPDGKIWTISYADLSGPLQVRDGFTGSSTKLTPPWAVGYAQLAFNGSTPIITIEKDGSITTGPYYASEKGGHWSSFHKVAHTWAVGTDADLTATHHGVRLITATDDASYRPVIAKWTGKGFSRRTLTADKSSCTPGSHDGYSDTSGRLVDVANSCDSDITIADFPNDNQAAIVRFPIKGTAAGGTPQIASTTRGLGVVAWSVEDGTTGDRLQVQWVRLPDRTTTVTKRKGKNRLTVAGPVSCLGVVSTPVRVSVHHAKGWKVGPKTLRLGSKKLHGSSLDGSKLKAGKTYSLHGSAVFHHGKHHHKKLKATLKFRSCPTG